MSDPHGKLSPEHTMSYEAGQDNDVNPPTAPMDGSLVKSGETSLQYARKAGQELKEGKIPGAQGVLVKAAVSAEKHKKLIDDQIVCCHKIEKYYKEQEEMLTTKINNALTNEQSLERERSAAQIQLDSERNQLSRYQSELRSAESRLDKAKRERREAENKRNAMIAVIGFATLLTFGAASAFAAAAVGAGAAAAAFNETLNDAEREISRCNNSISSTRERICQYEGNISTLNSRISQLNSEKSTYNEQRSQMQQEKGRIKEVIVFLCDAQRFWQDYFNTTEHSAGCTDHMADLLAHHVQTKEYRLFDSKGTELVLKSFEEAWDAFEIMTNEGTNYQFKMDFMCTRCGLSHHEFPHIANNQIICSDCQ